MARATKAKPEMAPPQSGNGGSVGTLGLTTPQPPSAEQLAEARAPQAGGAPTLAPPSAAEVKAAAGDAVAATWSSGTVTGLWSINEVRNAWMLIDGVGWRKLYNGRDGAFTALVTLASQARQTGRTINFRQEADGMVYEIYLW